MTLADLEATALKSVVDILVETSVVVTAGVCLAGLEAVVTGGELVCGILKLRLCFFVCEAGPKSAGVEKERLFLGCCPLPRLTGTLK